MASAAAPSSAPSGVSSAVPSGAPSGASSAVPSGEPSGASSAVPSGAPLDSMSGAPAGALSSASLSASLDELSGAPLGSLSDAPLGAFLDAPLSDSAMDIQESTGTYTQVTDTGLPSSAMETLLHEKDAEILFLKRTNEGLLADLKELQNYAEHCNITQKALLRAHSELEKSFKLLKNSAEKDSAGFLSKLTDMQRMLDEMSSATGKFALNQSKARKAYHELKDSQKFAVNKDLRENLFTEINNGLKKRKVEVIQAKLVDTTGNNPPIEINSEPKHTFQQLTPAELETVEAMADLKVIHGTSNAAYRANRNLIKDLPPLSHLKQHDETIYAAMPPIEPAPNRPGGFTPLRHEVTTLAESLDQKEKIDITKPLPVKLGIDATVIKHNVSGTAFTLEVIGVEETEIGLVGLVEGSDHATDLEKVAMPFFSQAKELDSNPVLKTSFGDVTVKLRGGGDLVSTLHQLGCGGPTSTCPCPVCILRKADFWKCAFDLDLVKGCNGIRLGRTRANITNEAIKSKPEFSVKRSPLCPLPSDPNMLILDWMVLCCLHAEMRITG